ncbi:MAG: biopolymer transporter ExbD [Proteobacteria bacterium]|nr:biopolymer transporter ExbD [Pseudomonadota bacterium]MDE3208713.1 biopolymer transporter ExbD [Pseudomonadota bacterium]
MHFQRILVKEEPEVNLIPMIDVLLVILLFLMVTTTFSKMGELSIVLPKASMAQSQKSQSLHVVIDRNGQVTIQGHIPQVPLSKALKNAAKGNPAMVVIIDADARTTQQAVITVMEAARQAGLDHIAFAIRQTRS